MSNLKIGDKVRHNYSGETGYIIGYDPNADYGYVYEVDFGKGENDWFKSEVLELI